MILGTSPKFFIKLLKGNFVVLKKENRLRKNSHFSYVYKKGKAQHTAHFSMIYCYSRWDTKVGFSVSNKLGKAVKRNHLKRQMREVIRLNFDNIKSNFSIVFIAKIGATELNYEIVEKDLIYLLKKGDLIVEKK